MLLLCVPGLVALGFAVREARKLQGELRTWPRVQAHVDSVAVVSWTVATRQASYAQRFWLGYRYDGRTWRRQVTTTYSNDWAAEAHAADAARQRGSVTLLVNPGKPTDVALEPGYTVSFFLWPVILAGVGVFLLFMGFGIGSSARGSRAEQPPVRPASRKSAYGEAILAGAMGLLFVCVAAGVLSRARGQRATWEATTARVDSADVVQQRKTGRGGTQFTSRLWISYEWNGRVVHRPVMTGNAWTRDPFAARRDAEDAWHAGPTTIWVNPRDPYRATLDPVSGGNLVLPVTFALVGLGLVAFGIYRWRSLRLAAA
jgi:hypothetical protein